MELGMFDMFSIPLLNVFGLYFQAQKQENKGENRK